MNTPVSLNPTEILKLVELGINVNHFTKPLTVLQLVDIAIHVGEEKGARQMKKDFKLLLDIRD